MNKLMELVERYVLASNGLENALVTNEHFREAQTEFEGTKAEIQKIADDYERTKQQRDKLLAFLKFLKGIRCNSSRNWSEYDKEIEKKLAECEADKK